MPERRLERGREHQLTEALQTPPEAPAGSFQALGIPDRALQALGRRVCEGAYPVWAGVPAAFAAGRGQSVDIWAKAKQPRGQGEARENVGRRDYFRRWTAVQRST